MPEIGSTLREARMRERIDVSEIEAKTKIRAKYLRALENEEWGLLPGPTFVKSFLRTYATALGLDGKALVEEYRLHHERPSEGIEPIVSSPQRNRGRDRRSPEGASRGYMIAVAGISAVIIILIILLVTSNSSKGPAKTASTTRSKTSTSGKHHTTPASGSGSGRSAASDIVTLSITPTSAVYVCLLGDGGHKLIPGVELKPGRSTPTYHAKRFEITLGNNAVELLVDGKVRPVPASSTAIGYSITKARGRRTLPAAQQPTCQ
jgi:cytoskeletal protein RodZ